MQFINLKIAGAWVHEPIRHHDSRGSFEEVFRLSLIQSCIGRSFDVVQVNQSTSAKGVIRGIHYTLGGKGQAKYISCTRGRLWDVVIDLRIDSPTFGLWEGVELTPENGRSVLISEGLGHAFLSLEEGSVATYLCTSEYNPGNDRALNPFSTKLAIPFADIGYKYGLSKFEVSSADQAAPEFGRELLQSEIPFKVD